jgi:outer membrane protein OmpA-like peptidoglycan-associated protein
MSNPRNRRTREGADGADAAIWVSFADLMTALMVLFLLLMVLAMMAVGRMTPAPRSTAPKPVTVPEPRRSAGPDERIIDALLQQVAQAVQATPGLHLDHRHHVIDFGDRARFHTGSHELDAASARLLREFVPRLLAVTESAAGRQAVARVVVEGFADHRGDYLYNLNLSLQRSQRVICTLLEAPPDGSGLAPGQAAAVRALFAVGGFSFNDQRESLDASRRIEMRIEFGPRATPRGPALAQATLTGPCRLPRTEAATPAQTDQTDQKAPEPYNPVRPGHTESGHSAVFEARPARAPTALRP